MQDTGNIPKHLFGRVGFLDIFDDNTHQKKVIIKKYETEKL